MKNKTIKINVKTLSAAAYKAGTTMEEFVSQIRSLSLGRKVCAHLLRTEDSVAVFSVE